MPQTAEITVRVADAAPVRKLIDACRALDAIMAEFPDEPRYWGEHLQGFDAAMVPFREKPRNG